MLLHLKDCQKKCPKKTLCRLIYQRSSSHRMSESETRYFLISIAMSTHN